jgi:hypothetical protein
VALPKGHLECGLIFQFLPHTADYGEYYENEVIDRTGEKVNRGNNVQYDHQCYQDTLQKISHVDTSTVLLLIVFSGD